MKQLRVIIQTTVIVLLFSLLAQSQQTTGGFILKPDHRGNLDFDPVLARNLQETLENMRINNNIRGLSAAALVPGKGLWLGVSGYSSLYDSVSQNMLFNLSGADRSILVALMLKLEYSGTEFSLNNPVSNYLEDLPPTIPGQITVRDLFNPKTRMRDYLQEPTCLDTVGKDPNCLWNFESIIDVFMNPNSSPVEDHVMGDNTNFLLASEIVCQVTKSNMANALHQEILNPLSLENIFYPPDESLPLLISHPWNDGIDNNNIVKSNAWLSLHASPGGMFATAEDLTNFLYATFSGRLLSQSSIEKMRSITKPWGANTSNSRITWRENIFDKNVWDFGGRWEEGYSSAAYYDSSTGFTFSVLGNENKNLYNIAPLFFQTYLKSLPVSASAPKSRVFLLSSTPSSVMYTAGVNNNNSILETTYLSKLGAVKYPNTSRVKIHPITGDLWGLSNTPGIGYQLVQFDAASGEAFPRVDISITTTGLTAMAFKKDGTLYLGSNNGQIFTVDLVTGIANSVVKAPVIIRSMVFSNQDNLLVSTNIGQSSDRIVIVDMISGDTTGHSNTGWSESLKDMAYDDNGEGILYGIISNPARLISFVSIAHGSDTAKIVTTFNSNNINSLTFSKEAIVNSLPTYSKNNPVDFGLGQNFPNPFNPQTTIEYQISDNTFVTLEIYNLLGKKVTTLVNKQQTAGTYSIIWDASDFASGVYLYQLKTTNGFVQSKKLLLLK